MQFPTRTPFQDSTPMGGFILMDVLAV